MKITKEELERIIREELEAILDEGKKEYGTGENYSQRRKRQKKLRPNIDPKDKTGEETDYHDINKQMADKFRGKYKKLKEEDNSVNSIISSLGQEPDSDVLNKLYYKVKDLPSSNPTQERAKKMAAGSIGSALKNVDATGAVNLGRENFIKRAIKHLSDYERADSVDVQDPTME